MWENAESSFDQRARQSDFCSMAARVLIVDDHAVVRSGLKLLLAAEDDIEVVAEAGDADTAARYVKGHRPTVLILDVNMPGESGLAAIPRIRGETPETQIVVLTMQDETAVARQALMVGWGEGLDQAAAYLNRLPGAERLTVSTQYHHVLRLAFDGRTVRVPSPRPVDYYVVYANMIQRNTVPIPVRQAVADGHPVFTATVNGVPFAWVYRGPFTIATQRDVPGEVEDEQDDTPTN